MVQNSQYIIQFIFQDLASTAENTTLESYYNETESTLADSYSKTSYGVIAESINKSTTSTKG